MKIGIASDHAGFNTKEKLKEILSQYEIIDYGNKEYDETDDYPVFAFQLGKAIVNKEVDYGIILCSNGIGVSIASNKVNGIRCALVSNLKDAIHSRNDNDANIIALNAQEEVSKLNDYILAFINTPFSRIERHQRRIDEISKYESDLK